MKDRLFENGTFFTGCNYWASHAGTNMWSDWREDIVDDDLRRLSENNIRVLRVFPLWSDFQPLKMHYAGGGTPYELRLRENPLPFTEAGQAGIDEVMLERFTTFCDLAQKYNIHLIIGLITGWMSGRLHMPEAFAGRNLLTDPHVVRWQIRFVKYMVNHYKSHPAVAAWDLGNECNCMQGGISADAAYCWSAQITDAIRSLDKSHPVISGMHGLIPNSAWTPADQGEVLDILCTHPYPIFTPHCDTDPINQIKNILHATAESVMYESLGKKPCFVEEAGTLGPMIADEQIAADYIRASVFSSWAHDLKGFVWWCANEQTELEHTPYDWCAVERELGLFHTDGSNKPVLNELSEFTRFIDSFEFKKLPCRIQDAVCVLTRGQDTWASAYGSFILAKQSGIDLSFSWCEDELPESDVYLMPSLSQNNSISRHALSALLSRVKAGATLYLSLNDALLSPFYEYTGVKVITRSRRTRQNTAFVNGSEIRSYGNIKYRLRAEAARTLVSDDEGEPVLTEYDYDKGKVFFCAYPIELAAACEPGSVYGNHQSSYYQIYRALGLRNPKKAAVCGSEFIGMCEHIVDDDTRLLTILNQSPSAICDEITLNGYTYARTITYRGGECTASESGFTVRLPANTGLVAVIKRNNE